MPNPYLARREQARRIEKSAGAETGRDREQPRGLGHDQAHRTALLRPEVLLLLPVAGISPSLRLHRIVRALRPADAGRRHGSGEELRKGAAVEVGIVLREEAGDERHRPRAGVGASEEEVLARRKGDGRPRGSTLLRCSVVFGHGCCRLRISAAANEKRVILGLFFSLSLSLSVCLLRRVAEKSSSTFAVGFLLFIFSSVWLPSFCAIWKGDAKSTAEERNGQIDF